MAATGWEGVNVEPGDRVRTKPWGEGIVAGSLYRGHQGLQVRLLRKGKTTVVLGRGDLYVVEAAPVFEVGEMTSQGEVLERWEREDAPGYMYRVKTGTNAEGEDRSTVVGPEKLKVT